MHEVENMFYQGGLPWHGLGRHVDRNLRWNEAIREGGLDWDVELRPVYVQGPQDFEAARGFKGITRSTDCRVFGVVTDQYQPIQNREAFAIFEGIFGDQAVLHTAGSLKGGREVWGLAEFPDDMDVEGDRHRKFLLVSTRHDGSGALRAFPTAVRVVCANTLGLAMHGRENGISIRHTGNIGAKVQAGVDALAQTVGLFKRHQADLSTLVRKPLTSKAIVEALLEEWFPGDTPQKNTAKAKVIYLANHGKGNAPFRGTAYALYQGVTEFVDHAKIQKGSTGDRRFEYALFGAGAKLKTKALADLLQVTA